MNPYKQVEMYKQFRPLVPPKYWNEELYQKPSKDVYNLVKYEVESRKGFKGELNKVKTQAICKDKIKRKL